jgi:hypothetical protein
MLKVDLEKFWEDDKLAHEDNCFSPQAPQVAMGIRMSDECVFAELGEPGQPWGSRLMPGCGPLAMVSARWPYWKRFGPALL